MPEALSTPPFPGKYPANGGLMNPKPRSNNRVGEALGTKYTDLFNCRKSKATSPIPFAAIIRPSRISSPLGPHIPHIVGLSAEPKVRGSATPWDIARMEDLQSFWDGSIGQNPGRIVGKHTEPGSFRPKHPGGNLTVAESGSPCRPQPASRCDLDFDPKALNEIGGKPLRGEVGLRIVRPLDQVHFDCVTLSGVGSPRGHFTLSNQPGGSSLA
jgi:hypothetical protein